MVVDVGDFDSAMGDYGRMLGQEPVWLESNAERRTRSALFPLANMVLEIRGDSGAAESAAVTETKGLSGLRLACDDVERFAQQLASDGIAAGLRVSEKAERDDSDDADNADDADVADGEGARSWVSTTLDRAASRGISVELISDEEGMDRVYSPAVDPQSAIRALDHVVVFSADAEATRDFYRDLGIRLALDRTFEKRGVRLLFFRIAGVTIEIGGRLGVERQPDGTDRFGGLAWQVLDIDAIRSRLLADRFDVSEIRDGNKAGTRVCTVREPVHDVPTLLIEPVS